MNKVKALFEKYSKELLVGVIVSVLTTWIIKGFDWLKEIAPAAGNSAFNAFLGFFYSNLANMSDSSLLSLLLYVALAFYIVFLMNTVLKGFSTSNERIQIGKEIKSAVDSVEKGEAVNKDKKELEKKTLGQIKEEAEEAIKDGRKMRKIAIASFIFVVLYLFFIVTTYIAPNLLWESYKRDVTKIKPYVEQQEIEQIESDWVCMKTKEDYDAIYKIIDDVKEKHNLP